MPNNPLYKDGVEALSYKEQLQYIYDLRRQIRSLELTYTRVIEDIMEQLEGVMADCANCSKELKECPQCHHDFCKGLFENIKIIQEMLNDKRRIF